MSQARAVLLLLLACTVSFAALGCLRPKGASVDEKRSYVRKMRNDTLRDMYARKPELEREVRNAAGYAVFSNLEVKIFLFGPGQGYGMLIDNANQQETFMRMGQLGAGVGMGIQKFRGLFIFRDPQTLATFRDSGWQFGGDAAVAAKVDDVGAAGDAQGKVAGSGAALGGGGSAGASGEHAGAGAGMVIYRITDTGLALSASVNGTKYWRDGGLN